MQFARLLGRAAAANLIVGRVDSVGRVVFDDGDEVVVDLNGLPVEIALADQLGTFGDTTSALVNYAPDHAKPVNVRVEYLAHPDAFAEEYLLAVQERFAEIQDEYRKRRSAFDAMFQDRDWGPRFNIAARWAETLQRLEQTDPQALTDGIRRSLKLS